MITSSQRKELNIKLQELKLIVTELTQLESGHDIITNDMQMDVKIKKIIKEYNIKNFGWDYESWRPPHSNSGKKGNPNDRYQSPIRCEKLLDHRELYKKKIKELKDKIRQLMSEIYILLSDNMR